MVIYVTFAKWVESLNVLSRELTSPTSKKKEHHRLCLLWVEYVSFEEGTPAMEPENGPWKRRFRTPSFSGEPCYTSGVCTLEN